MTLLGSRFFSVLVAVVIFAAATPASSEDTPQRLVESFQRQLLAAMKTAESGGFDDRYRRLDPAISETFHLTLMIRIATGEAWDTATEDQKYALVAGFHRMSVSTVATLFRSYSGQRFETLGVRPGTQRTTLVDTELVNSDGRRVSLTYVAKQFQGGWRLIDVVVDNGISELNVRRSEYHRVLASEGVEGLIATLNRKADELAEQKEKKR